jgi:predicted RNase H-like nuclease
VNASRALGLDGFSKGWVAVFLDDDDAHEISFHGDITQALSRPFDRAGIDIPIGMNDDGERDCDVLARAMLRPHGSRVFGGARRWLWQAFTDPDRANVEADRRRQKKASRQLWHLGQKIMEVDAFLGADSSRDIREVHPELVFLRLNGNKPLASKKSPEGIARRRALLKRAGIRHIDRWLTHDRIGTGAKADDVLDACAVAIAAREPAGSVPDGTPPLDAFGLPMRIWF